MKVFATWLGRPIARVSRLIKVRSRNGLQCEMAMDGEKTLMATIVAFDRVGYLGSGNHVVAAIDLDASDAL
jgi:hypothetical protein